MMKECFYIDGKIDYTISQLLRKHLEIYGSSAVLMINSGGGDAYSITGICSLLKIYEPSVVVYGNAMSAACVIASFGKKGKRTCSPYASFMMHNIKSLVAEREVETDIKKENHKKETERLNACMYSLLFESTGTNREVWTKSAQESAYNEFYFGADKAVELGIIDFVNK